jgi:ubiquinone/menaquinone biosynthesis C-methylase UbiE
LAHNTDLSIYQYFEANPEQALSFVGSLKALTSSPEYQISHIIDNYDWASHKGALVVDIGGSRGNIAINLAERFPELRFVVQDLEKVIQGAEDDIPKTLKGRIRFEVRDLFALQTVEADIYFLRWILHNWPDKYW